MTNADPLLLQSLQVKIQTPTLTPIPTITLKIATPCKGQTLFGVKDPDSKKKVFIVRHQIQQDLEIILKEL